ncbi:MAG: NUDIX domain-containing protein [Thaumarchaeota archaeon]|nr:MAG: NUDIX domain-containing protein [Nitrososphaerota archaeon]TLX96291.1 MAG: NUDIX domain-containing protein [Nitrososphaerota archaeon]
MNSTKIVTCFLTKDNKYLILRRSDKVKTMKSLWAAISGIIEGNEEPLHRAKTEIFEETRIPEVKIGLLRAASQMRVDSPQYVNHEWLVYPFLFSVKDPVIELNWENSEYRWISPSEITQYRTVPSLDKVLASLL